MTTETKEIWKPVAGYEGIYDVYAIWVELKL